MDNESTGHQEGGAGDEVGKTVFRFFNEIGIIQQLSSAMFNRRLPDGLHVSHFSILNHLIRLSGGKTPLALASAFQVTKGTMTHTLAVLAKRDLIAIEPHPTDGRSKIIFLTDQGRAFHGQAIASLVPTIKALADKIDWAAVSALLPELQRVRQVLDENRDI